MASKADVEAREAECNSVEDFVNLAQDAPADVFALSFSELTKAR